MSNESVLLTNALKALQAGLSSAAPTAAQQVMLFNTDGTPAGKYAAQKLLQDLATAGNGYGVCSTEAATAAKVVAVSNFILIKYGIVSVRFQKGISVSGATLNVNSTGAKAIQLNGIALPANVVSENTIVVMQYDGTNWQIIAINKAASSSDELLVDMGLSSGVRWATRNIDVTQANGFAATPYQYECSFVSWGNTTMHNPISTSAFQYDFGSANDGPYASTPGAALTADAGLGYDAARVNLGGSWRLPTTAEFAELFANINYLDANGDVIDSATTDKRCSYNGVMGLRLQSKFNGKELFFPCSGFGHGASWLNRGSNGYYWSASLYSATHGRNLRFSSEGVNPQDSNHRFFGFAVRPVQ
jgi:hypothetical protein